MRRRAPRPVAAALDGLLASLAPQTVLGAVQRVWPDAVGAAFAAQAEPVGESDGSIRVACRSAVWAQELELMAPSIVDRLNELLERPAVCGLRCETRLRRR